MERAATATTVSYGIYSTEFLREGDNALPNERAVYLVDFKTGTSITNGAEGVVAEIAAKYPNYRIVYRDSVDVWSELAVRDGQFSGFKSWSGWHPTNEETDAAIAQMDE